MVYHPLITELNVMVKNCHSIVGLKMVFILSLKEEGNSVLHQII